MIKLLDSTYVQKKSLIFTKIVTLTEMFAYVLEFVLSFDKMQNTSPLMCTNCEILGHSILKVIQAVHTVRIVLNIGCSGPVVEFLNKISMLQSTTSPLGVLYEMLA